MFSGKIDGSFGDSEVVKENSKKRYVKFCYLPVLYI